MRSTWGRWWRPVLLAAFIELVVVGGTVISPNTHLGRRADVLGAALVLTAGATVAVARRWPAPALTVALLATVSYYGLGYAVDTSFFIPLAVTGYASSTADGRRRGALFVVATFVAFVVAATGGRTPNSGNWLWVAVIVAAAQLAGQVAAELRARSDRQAAAVREEEARRQLAEERLRIARELHDVVSHSMAVINVHAGAAAHVIDRHPEQAREALETIRATSQQAMRDLRSILGVMREADEDEPLTPAPGLDQVTHLVERIRRSGVAVELDIDGAQDAVAPSASLAAYRVVQEALTNVVRHAPGAAARVSVRLAADEVVVDVENDEPASSPVLAAGAGHGLSGMRERVRAAGGHVEAGPREQGGFSVHVTLPLNAG